MKEASWKHGRQLKVAAGVQGFLVMVMHSVYGNAAAAGGGSQNDPLSVSWSQLDPMYASYSCRCVESREERFQPMWARYRIGMQLVTDVAYCSGQGPRQQPRGHVALLYWLFLLSS